MARVLIVGYGNPLRGDDGVGWHAAERLARTLGNENTKILALSQLTLDVVDYLASSDLAIFIDACQSDGAGELTLQPLESDGLPGTAFEHQLDPAALLVYALCLYGKRPEGLLVTLSGENFGFGEKLSPAVGEMMPLLVERVEQAVARFGREDRPEPGATAPSNAVQPEVAPAR